MEQLRLETRVVKELRNYSEFRFLYLFFLKLEIQALKMEIQIVARGGLHPNAFPHKVPETSAWSKRLSVVISRRISDVPTVPLFNAPHHKPLQWRPYD